MLILPTNPLFLDTMIQFVHSFTPTLSIHRVHIAERRSDLLSLQIEMTDGTLMFVEAEYLVDRIQVVLEYGWQRVDIWMYANFPNQDGGASSPKPPLNHVAYSQRFVEATSLEVNGVNEVAMDGVFSQDIYEELFELRRETRFDDSPFGDLLGHCDLSGMKLETVCRSVSTDVVEESRFVFKGNGLKNGTLKKSELPKTHSGFKHSILRPGAVDGQLEQPL